MQRGSNDDRVFLGLIRKVDEGTENEALGGPSDMEKLRRPDLPSAIEEVLEAYSDVFPSELPNGVPTSKDGSGIQDRFGRRDSTHP